MMDDAYDRLRARQGASHLVADIARAPSQSPAFVGSVFASQAVPTATGCYYSVHPVLVLGVEGETNPGSLTVDTSTTVLVYVAGGRPPVSGDSLICRFIGHRWVAERLLPGSGGVAVAGCFCTSIPATLRMSSSRPTSNGGMFQNCTLQYGATPASYNGLAIGAQSYLSTASFADQFGNKFQYYFYCQRNQFFLSRVYVNSVFGSPFQDSVRYLWTMTSAGNTCSPFLLGNGQIYSGGDASCIVTISA